MYNFQTYNPTDPGQIGANRSGAITPEQKTAMKWHADPRWGSLITTVVLLAVLFPGLLLVMWFVGGSQLPLWGYAILLGFFGIIFVVGVIPQVWTMVGALRARSDLENARLEALEGQVTWRGNKYAAEVPGRTLRLPLGMAGLRPGSYRFYFLTNTGWLLSAERFTPPGCEDLNAE